MKVRLHWPDEEIVISTANRKQTMYAVQCIMKESIRVNISDPEMAQCCGLSDETVAFANGLLETEEISEMSIDQINAMLYDWGWVSTITEETE
jgi:hypothetical protein